MLGARRGVARTTSIVSAPQKPANRRANRATSGTDSSVKVCRWKATRRHQCYYDYYSYKY